MNDARIAELEARVTEYEQTIRTFARLHAELADLRDSVTVPESGSRIQRMLVINAENLNELKRSLAVILGTLRQMQAARVLPAPASV